MTAGTSVCCVFEDDKEACVSKWQPRVGHPALPLHPMATNRLNLDGLLIFEQPFARVISFLLFSLLPGLTLPSSGSVRELPQSLSYRPEEHRARAWHHSNIFQRARKECSGLLPRSPGSHQSPRGHDRQSRGPQTKSPYPTSCPILGRSSRMLD
jgi:hypothetical protein